MSLSGVLCFLLLCGVSYAMYCYSECRVAKIIVDADVFDSNTLAYFGKTKIPAKKVLKDLSLISLGSLLATDRFASPMNDVVSSWPSVL